MRVRVSGHGSHGDNGDGEDGRPRRVRRARQEDEPAQVSHGLLNPSAFGFSLNLFFSFPAGLLCFCFVGSEDSWPCFCRRFNDFLFMPCFTSFLFKPLLLVISSHNFSFVTFPRINSVLFFSTCRYVHRPPLVFPFFNRCSVFRLLCFLPLGSSSWIPMCSHDSRTESTIFFC
jgi:hypothetical protein